MARPVIQQSSGQINIRFQAETAVTPLSDITEQRIIPFQTKSDHLPLERVLKELDRLVGLKHVKDFVYEIYAWLYITKKRQEMGLKASQQSLHMVFKGNPGTGKTTVARILASLFQEMGVLTKGHLVEVERGDLVGEYIGHTAQKTKELVKKSLGGILFIDEAYSLARGGDKDFGKEAIDCLVKSMEDYRNDFILILAGYPDEMDYFMSSNPGLPSRFPIQLEFRNYTLSELMAIAKIMVEDREYQLSAQAEQKLKIQIQQQIKASPFQFSNARYVRNVIEKAIREHAVRLLQHPATTRLDLMTLSAQDLVSLDN